MTPTRFSVLFLALIGCSSSPEPVDFESTSTDYSESLARKANDGPCDGGGWGAISQPNQSWHVSALGSDASGTGSATKPFLTLQKALDAAVRAGDKTARLAVGPGDFSQTSLVVTSGGKLEKISIQGCGVDQTRIRGRAGKPILDVVGVDGDVSGVTLQGGRRALTAREKSTISASDVRVEGSELVGAVAYGAKSKLDFDDVTVTGTRAVDGVGWGVAVLDGTLDMKDGEISDNVGIGVYADGGSVKLRDVEILDTAVSATYGMGRGVHVQDGTDLYITGGSIQRSTDAAVFALSAGSIFTTRIVIDIISAGIVIDFPSSGLYKSTSTGDGFVVYDTSSVDLSDSSISGADRTAILIDSSDATLENVDTSGTDTMLGGYTTFTQAEGSASVYDADNVDAVEVLDLESPLPIDLWTVPTP